LQNWDEDFDKIMKRKMKSFMDKNYDHDSNLDSRYNNQKELYPNVPIPLTDYNFNESIGKYRFLIVDFWAAWCGPCRMISPIIEQLSLELAGKVVFGKLNVDENPYVSNAFEVKSIPTIIIFKDGKLADRLIGAMTKSQLYSRISSHLHSDQ
jgi:thioredoxin 1